ncbi:MAG TPA: hypothetical protein GX509_01840, partial [Firmicutes bacterium]|nr:hypothetical protein [Bacillota bacterium]
YEDFVTIIRSETIKDFTDSDRTIYEKAWELFTRNWASWRKVRLIGVGVSSLVERRRYQKQLSLFDDGLKQAAVDRTVDTIRRRFGRDSIMRAGAMILCGPRP